MRQHSSPLIEPDVPISGIPPSDSFHREAQDVNAETLEVKS
jgi:hypothetical protein